MDEWISKYYGVLIVVFLNCLTVGYAIYAEFKDDFGKYLRKTQNSLDN